jgi:hypothetical protein
MSITESKATSAWAGYESIADEALSPAGRRRFAESQRPASGRLPVEEVLRLHDAIGGDPVTEDMILRFIGDQYSAKSLLYLSPKVAAAILARPVDFIRAAKRHCEPAVPF